jgi:hypothetical protein
MSRPVRRIGIGLGARLPAVLLPSLLIAAACSSRGPSADDKAGDILAGLQGEHYESVSELGPVKAVLRVGPKNPTLGDPITLLLEVTAEPDVVVEMPDFGEALGRFSIIRYVPRESTRDGKWVATQVYTLDAPMSGKQRIPPLRIEFVDERDGQAAGQKTAPAAGQDPGAGDTTGDADAPGGVRELLTDEIALDVGSVLLDDHAQLSEPPGRLRAPATTSPLWQNVWFWLAVGLVLASGLAVALFYGSRHSQTRRRESAYVVAMARLGKLEHRGLPEPGEADAWYVELSSIIRHYLEDRYNLRAPELTTEEFLQVARGSGVLTIEHRKLLEDFLLRCDRVKFAGYAPDDAESRQTLDSARGFLHDTRPEAEAVAAREAESTAARAGHQRGAA